MTAMNMMVGASFFICWSLLCAGSTVRQTDLSVTKGPPWFRLDVTPHDFKSVRRGRLPVLTISVRNICNHAERIRIYTLPVPFGTTDHITCLQFRCINERTGREVRYL
jgi:hypothetical protein